MKSQDRNAQSNKGTFVAIGLCVVLYLLWNQYLTRKYPNFGQQRKDVAAQKNNDLSPPPVAQSTSESQTIQTPLQANTQLLTTPMAPRDLVIDTKDATFTFRQDLGTVSSVKLKHFKEKNAADSSPVELLARPATVQAYASPPPAKTTTLPFTGERVQNTLKFSRIDGPFKIDQSWTIPSEGYAGKVALTFTNLSDAPKPLTASVLVEMGSPVDASKSGFFGGGQPADKPRFLTQTDGSDEFKSLEDFCKDQALEINAKDRNLDFFGLDNHYFAFALLPKAKANYHTTFVGRGTPTNPLCEIMTVASSDFGTIAPKSSSTVTYDVWLGPKEDELFAAFNPHLRTTLGLGWLDMIAHPLLLAIKGLYKFTGNYGVAIILLTFLLKILFFPLTRQAAYSAARMKKLNPEMTKLRERYKSDQQKMQMELMKFMSANKINPMKGCLPILPTIPVFFALFRVLSASIDLRHAPFYGWISDLSAKDPLLITPIILTGLMFIQQRLTPMTGMDKSQEKIMMFMPIIFGVMMISLPSGLVLYMMTNTITSIVQQQYLNKKFANVN